MSKVTVGDYVTIIKSGTFDNVSVTSGSRARVVGKFRGSGSRSMKNKHYADIVLFNKDDQISTRFTVPMWWLRPRSVLDDLTEI